MTRESNKQASCANNMHKDSSPAVTHRYGGNELPPLDNCCANNVILFVPKIRPGHYAYVDPGRIPQGWHQCGRTASGKVIIERKSAQRFFVLPVKARAV